MGRRSSFCQRLWFTKGFGSQKMRFGIDSLVCMLVSDRGPFVRRSRHPQPTIRLWFVDSSATDTWCSTAQAAPLAVRCDPLCVCVCLGKSPCETVSLSRRQSLGHLQAYPNILGQCVADARVAPRVLVVVV